MLVPAVVANALRAKLVDAAQLVLAVADFAGLGELNGRRLLLVHLLHLNKLSDYRLTFDI